MENHHSGHPSADEVRERINELIALEASDPTSFAEALADNIADPLAVDTHAFRSEELAFKSMTAATYLIQRTQEQARRFQRDKQRLRGITAFGHKVGRERRVLENIVSGIRARDGILSAAPNPRRRAKDRLWNEAMAGQPIKPGRWRELLNEERERDQQRKAEAKKARRQARKQNA